MDNFFIFLTAAFILAITPGPAIFYVLFAVLKVVEEKDTLQLLVQLLEDCFMYFSLLWVFPQ